MTESSVIEIFRKIDRDIVLVYTNRAFVVGINGIDTSGKSVFASRLVEYFRNSNKDVALINLDDFHNPKEIRNQGEDPVSSYFEHAFDYRRLIKSLLEPIRRGETIDIELDLLNLETNEYDVVRKYHIHCGTIVIVEGVLLYREPLNQYFDYRIYLDISFEELLRRATERDKGLFGDQVANRYISKYIPAQRKYIERHTPLEQADLVINNEDYTRPTISRAKLQ